MNKKIIGIIGTYRKGKIIDTAVSEVLRGARDAGFETKKIYLIDKHIEYCTNCRTCTQDSLDKKRGRCIHTDDMDQILQDIDDAEGIVLGSPVNFSTVTAVMKKFVERMVSLGYWPWAKPVPEGRIKKCTKKSIIVTASACPAFIGRILMPNCLSIFKRVSQLCGAKVIKSLYFGGLKLNENPQLPEQLVSRAYSAGKLFGK